MGVAAGSFERTRIDRQGPLAMLEWEGSRDRCPILCVHGADGSAANFLDLAPLLAPRRAVRAVDLPGFGRSPVAGRKTTMSAYAELVADLAATGPGKRAHLVGNSMGAVAVILAAARHPEAVASVSLLAPALPRAGRSAVDPTLLPMLAPFLVPGLMALEARRRHSQSPDRRVRELLEMCYAPDSGRESAAAFAEMVDVARERERRDQVKAWTSAFRNLLLWLARRRALHREAARIDAPVLLVEGCADPIIPSRSVAAALRRHPGWRHAALENVGHVPQLEAPVETARAISELIDALDGAPGLRLVVPQDH